MIFAGVGPVCRKEFMHISRDRGALAFALGVPIVQLIFFGFAIDTNIRGIPTALYDQERTQQSRRLIDAFVNSDTFRIARVVDSDDEMYRMMRAGAVKTAIKIPWDYSRRLAQGQTASILVLVDGSDSTISSFAISVSNGLIFQEALRRTGWTGQLPVDVRPSVLFNPGSRSPNFFVPGMIAVVLQMMLVMLTATSVVRERERGTLEQLSLTPVSPLGLMTGKMLPYGVLGFLELCAILLIMQLVFRVPINGNPVLLLALSIPFLVTALGLGLLISTRARTQAEAFQMSVGTLLPSVFLSGYIFLIDNMPPVFQVLSHAVPATYYIGILRGVILRGADLSQLWIEGLVLSVMGCTAVGLAAVQFVRRKQ
jgi:ABC-2 type transport system permease protein